MMGNVYNIAPAIGAAVGAELLAERRGLDPKRFRKAAFELVRAGHSAAWALTIVFRQIRREAAGNGPSAA